MYHNFLIHSFADGHLGCFQYLAIVNCAAMNIGVHRFFCEQAIVTVLTQWSGIHFSRALVPAESTLWVCHLWR